MNLKLDEHYQNTSGWSKVKLILGGILIISAACLTLVNLGFSDPMIHRQPRVYVLDWSVVWVVNITCGALGGALLVSKHYLKGAVAGVVSTACITGASLAYLSWREEVLIVEILIPLLTGLIGIGIYKRLTR